MTNLARFDITPAQIDAVVAAFYADVRVHPMLGRVFAEKVTDWPAHEAKIAAFWRGAILFEAGYDGNPMQTHKAAGNVRPGMFSAWLDVFDAVLLRELSPDIAAAWSALAHRIGAGLRYGLVEQATHAGGVPDLRG
ncbi:MAG: group III truncated hemoglobin [Octadecabacter sp.]